MAENYAREKATNKNSKDCRRASYGELDCKEPMSKQSAAKRKAEDCDR